MDSGQEKKIYKRRHNKKKSVQFSRNQKIKTIIVSTIK